MIQSQPQIQLGLKIADIIVLLEEGRLKSSSIEHQENCKLKKLIDNIQVKKTFA